MYLILKLYSLEELNSKAFRRFGEKFHHIVQLDNNINNLDIEEIEGCIAICANKESYGELAWSVEVKDIKVADTSINIKYELVEEIEFTNEQIKNALYGLLKRKGLIKEGQVPFLVTLNSDDMNYLRHNLSKKHHIKNIDQQVTVEKLFQENNWEGIYGMFAPIEKIEQSFPETWENEQILKNIAFACSKLGNVGQIPRELKSNLQEKKKYLAEKEKYRQNAEKLFKRCIDLDPYSPSYPSGLAYLYYNNVLDLTLAGGRRDGDVKIEIKNALIYFDKALSLDSTRIKDYYRKGALLTKQLANLIEFGGEIEDIEIEDIEIDSSDKKDFILKGIECLNSAIELWEQLDVENDKEKKMKDWCRKEYIKALYCRGKAYESVFYKYWNKVIYKVIVNDYESVSNVPILINKEDKEYLISAQKSYDKCWHMECELQDGIDTLRSDDINKNCIKWVIEAADKLYKLGNTYFSAYWLVKDNSKTKEDNKNYLVKACSCLQLALKVRVNSNYSLKQKYISERLARVYITQGEYNKADEILNILKLGNSDYYIYNTWALNKYLNKQYKQCIELLKDKVDEKRNKTIYSTKLILGAAYLKVGEHEVGKELLVSIEGNVKGNIHHFIESIK